MSKIHSIKYITTSTKIGLVALLSYGAFIQSIEAQDKQYSQFYANAMHLNPALTGAHSGTYRVMIGYRDQWRRSLEAPFTMMTVAADFTFPLSGSGNFSEGFDHVAGGIVFAGERVGIYDNNTNTLGVNLAYHKLIDKQTNQYLSLGFHFGLGLRSINYENLNFGDQFNGVNGYTEPTQEFLPNNGLAYGDVGLGLHYSVSPDRRSKFYLGASAVHLNRPNISYFARDIRLPEGYTPFALPIKYSAHGGASFPMGANTNIEPRIVYFNQGPHGSLTGGASLRYNMPQNDEVSLHLGAWMRTTRSLTTYQPTDIILTAGYEFNGLLIGISYDANLRAFSNFPGTNVFELSISFIGNHENAHNICPQF